MPGVCRVVTSVVVVAGVLASSHVAWAQSPQAAKSTRQRDLWIDAGFSHRVEPILPSQAKAQPELGADEVLSIERLIGDIPDGQEQVLVDLIAKTPDSAVGEKSDYYFQLGELYTKKQQYWRLQGIALTTEAERTTDDEQKSRLEADAERMESKAKEWLRKAARTYKALTTNGAFRSYPKMDIALFYYGCALHSGKYKEEARIVYDNLLKHYPSSRYAPEAHLLFGDYLFDKGQLEDAEARYRMVLTFPKSALQFYTKYKLAWVDFNKQRFQNALEGFLEVIQATRNDKSQESLNRASRKDFVRAYAEIGKADKALPAFQRVDARYAFDLLEILADTYLAQGKNDRAIYVYQDLMKRQPTSKNVCLWQYNIAHAMHSTVGAQNADKVKETENLVRLWAALKGKKTLPQAEAQECHDNAAAMSGELARAYHAESVKARNPELLAYAERLYRVYLREFPDANTFAEMEYLHAELLWSRAESERNPRPQTELWEAAATAFTDVVKHGEIDPYRMRVSAYAAVLSWKNALNIDPRAKQVADMNNPIDKNAQPRPIPEREQKMLAAFDVYIDYVADPTEDGPATTKFAKANTYRRYNHYEEAIPIFVDIVAHHKYHETAELAADLLLDIYNHQQRYDDMFALVDRLESDGQFLVGKDNLRRRLGDLRLQRTRKTAENLEAEAQASHDLDKFVACGQAYMDIYNRDPEASTNDEVLHSAAVCFEQGKSVGMALSAYNTLEKYYPNSKLTRRAVAQIGKVYARIAYYDRAADKLVEYSRTYAGVKDAYEAIQNVVYYRKGIGDDDGAIRDGNHFVDMFAGTRPAAAAGMMFSLTAIYEKQDRSDAVVKHLREYIRRFGDKGGMDRLVIAHAKIGRALWHQSCPVREVDGLCVKIVRERAADRTPGGRLRRAQGEQPLQCGPGSTIKLTVIKRDERKRNEARAAFAAAIREYERRGHEPATDELDARHHYALARLSEADRELESYLDARPPDDLDVAAASDLGAAGTLTKRLHDWSVQQDKLAGAPRAKYHALIAIKDAATSIAATARIGQIAQSVSDRLLTAAIPGGIRTGAYAGDNVDAFCDHVIESAGPLQSAAVEAYKSCLATSNELVWFGEWSKLCERELGHLRPEDFPTSTEVRADPRQVAPITAIEPPATRIE